MKLEEEKKKLRRKRKYLRVKKIRYLNRPRKIIPLKSSARKDSKKMTKKASQRHLWQVKVPGIRIVVQV